MIKNIKNNRFYTVGKTYIDMDLYEHIVVLHELDGVSPSMERCIVLRMDGRFCVGYFDPSLRKEVQET